MKEEQWQLGSALAIIERGGGTLRVRLQGLVTAMVIEAAHLRMAGERVARRELVLDHDAMLVLTPRSAAEAALRGTPAGGLGSVHIGVPSTRLAWALEHSLVMTQAGQRRTVSALDRWPAATQA